jgi:hypothetical protein
MSDIKTALEAALKKTADAWAEANQPQQEKAMESTEENNDGRTKSNVSRATFCFIRDNPGMTPDQATKILIDQGFKATSVSSLIGQMIRVRLVMLDDQGRMSAVVKEYIPLKSVRKSKTSKPVEQKLKQAKQVSTEEAPAPKAGLPAAVTCTTPPEWTVESVIGSLNVRQAMAVYAELRGIFGA